MKILGLMAISLLLCSGCSQPPAFESLADGPCTAAQSKEVSKHLSGQIEALSAKDWELAYSYASSSFRSAVPLDEFALVIGLEYQMLVDNTEYVFNDCAISRGEISQEVSVESKTGTFILEYLISVVDLKLGVQSAYVTSPAAELSL
jgi:hypothetical protein